MVWLGLGIVALLLAGIGVVSRQGVLGWWDGEAWVQWEPGVDVPLEGGEQYVSLTIETRGAAVGSAPRAPSGGGCGDGAVLAPVVDLTGEDGAPDRSPVAVTGPVGELAGVGLPPDNAEYERIAADEGGRLTQVVRTDLEGDGTDEVFLAVEDAGMSSLLLRRVDGGGASTEVLHRFVAENPNEGPPLASIARLAALVDVNVDGVAEAVVTYELGEAEATALFELSGDEPRQVLEADCPN